MIKAIAFDLDDTLLDTSGKIVPVAVKKAYESLKPYVDVNSFEEFNLLRNQLTSKMAHREFFKKIPSDFLAKQSIHVQSQIRPKVEEAIEKAIDAFYNPELPNPLPLLDGAQQNLEYLFPKYKLFLVTTGDPKTQQKKIDYTGTMNFFKNVYILNSFKSERKKKAFENILNELNLKPVELLSIGNRRSQEIRDAKSLGAQTCFFAFGDHKDEEPLVPEDCADFTVSSHREIIPTCRL